MTTEEAVTALNALAQEPNKWGDTDPEVDHIRADEVLLAIVPTEVVEAYNAVVDRSGWWAFA